MKKKEHTYRMIALIYSTVILWICAVGCFIVCTLRPGIGQAIITMLVFSAAVLLVAEIDTVEQEYTNDHALDKGGRTRGDM